MYLPKKISSVLVEEVKKLFAGLQYKWSILKGEVTTTVNVDCKWIKIHWNETMKLGLDFLKPVKVSELLAPVVGYIYAKFPELEKELKEVLKELDKKLFLTEGVIKVFKQQWENYKFTIEYAERKLVISQEYEDNYFRFTIDEELINEILKIAINSQNNEQEGLQDFVYSILPESIQEIVMKEAKECFEKIYEFKVHDELEKRFENNKRAEIDYDLDSKDHAVIVKIDNEKKYRFVIEAKDKCIVEINGKEFAICRSMSDVIACIEAM